MPIGSSAEVAAAVRDRQAMHNRQELRSTISAKQRSASQEPPGEQCAAQFNCAVQLYQWYSNILECDGLTADTVISPAASTSCDMVSAHSYMCILCAVQTAAHAGTHAITCSLPKIAIAKARVSHLSYVPCSR